MSENNKSNLFFYGSLVCAIWFALTASLWAYLANVFISFPVGVVSLFLCYKEKQIAPDNNRYKITLSILIAGAVVSLISLLFLR